MSPCLPEIYAQSYKDEQNLEIRCLCINLNKKGIGKRNWQQAGPGVRFVS